MANLNQGQSDQLMTQIRHVELKRDSAMSANISFPGRDDRDERNDNIVFSYIDGYVWMGWPGHEGRVRVGSYEATAASMRDFLAQCELAERLTRNGRQPTNNEDSGE